MFAYAFAFVVAFAVAFAFAFAFVVDVAVWPPHVNRDTIGKGQSGKQNQSGTRTNRGVNRESEPN